MDIVSASVLVTGATGGLGQAMARSFAARGARLLLTGRRSELLRALADEVSGVALACDLSRRVEVEQLIDAALAARVDVLVANAAVPATGVLTDLTQDGIDGMLEVNLRAPIALARGLAGEMVSRGAGHLLFVSSLSGRAASPASSIYSATKFGLRGFALSLREDLRTHGVGVSVVAPGFVRDAGMFADTRVRLPWGVGTSTPREVAAAVITAIERDRAEVTVAPPLMRLGASFAGLAPGVAAAASRRLGSHRVAAEMAAGQRDKR